jgi:hypothetical protein
VKFICYQICDNKIFVQPRVKASLARKVNFCFLLSVLTGDFLFLFLPFLNDCKVLECNSRDETDNKWKDLRIQDRYTAVQKLIRLQ